jgi:trimeric autotransporter adhesin
MNAMRHTRPLRARVPRLAWMVVLLGLSCDSPTGPESGKIRRVAAISVDPVAPTVVLGTDVPLSAVVKDQDGDVIPDAKVVWSVRDTAIASVSSTGVVTPRVVGGTQVAANASGWSAIATITIRPRPVSSVAIEPAAISLTAGRNTTLRAALTDASGALAVDRAVAWTTSDALVAAVSDAGVVTAIAPGSATISATSEGKTGSAAVTVTRVPVGSVAVEPSSVDVVIGQTRALTATVRDLDGSVVTDRPVTWSSSNTLVATVSEAGILTAVAPGSATIDATAGGRSGSATVAISLVPVASVSVNPPVVSVVAGQSATLAATMRDASGQLLSDRAVTWSSSNTLVATVTSSGVVTAIMPGGAAITATSEGQSGSASVTVTAVPVASVTVSPPTASMMVGSKATLSATLKDASGATLTDRAISWSSSNSLVAEVSSAGVVTARSAGSATITATSEGQRGTAVVTVTTVPVGTVAIQPSSLELDVGRTTGLAAIVKDANGTVVTDRVVSWKSSNTAVATVTAAGIVKAIMTGTATITATSEGKSGTSALTATPAPVGSVTVSPSSVTKASGESVTFSATVRDTTGAIVTGRAVEWSSSDTRVATVTPSGVVTALGTGTATIVATSELQGGSGKITVTPGPVATVTLTPETAVVRDEQTIQLTATAADAQGNAVTGRAFTWSTSDGGVATVSSTGLVKGKRTGTVTITATLDGKFDRTTVTVIP